VAIGIHGGSEVVGEVVGSGRLLSERYMALLCNSDVPLDEDMKLDSRRSYESHWSGDGAHPDFGRQVRGRQDIAAFESELLGAI